MTNEQFTSLIEILTALQQVGSVIAGLLLALIFVFGMDRLLP